MEEQKHCIYMHKNKVNGKIYIGQTFQDSPNKRWQNGHGYITQPKFFSDIVQYGWLNFEHYILEDNLTQEEANQKEEFWIKYFNSCEDGYNTRSKSNRVRKNDKGVIICLNTNKKYKTLKEASLDTGIDPSAISRCYGGQRKSAGTVNGMPRFWILTTSDKSLIDTIKENYNKEKMKQRKIICLETSRIFSSIDEVIEYCGLPLSSANKGRLRRVLDGNNASFGRDKKLNIKLHWQYYD